jgi:hypothetical protein
MKPTDDRLKSAGRTAKGTFAPGNPGGPGRPHGRGPVAELRAALAADLNKILDKLREQALAGDVGAARVIVERVLPAYRAEERVAPIALPVDGSLVEQARAVVQAAADGELGPGQAVQIVSALGGVAKLIESEELARRVAVLEARHDIP